MSHWRKRIGARREILLAESLRIAHDTGALKMSDLARVTVDATVQPKAITFPTDAKLLETAIRQFAKLTMPPCRRCHVNQEKHMSDWRRRAMLAG
jgi:IS5 family transposase